MSGAEPPQALREPLRQGPVGELLARARGRNNNNNNNNNNNMSFLSQRVGVDLTVHEPLNNNNTINNDHHNNNTNSKW